MTLDEAIERYKDNAEYERTHGNLQGCLKFIQLVKWLKELRAYCKYHKDFACPEIDIEHAPTIIEADKECKVGIINRGNCMMCGKELDEGLFFCKECEAKAESEETNADSD